MWNHEVHIQTRLRRTQKYVGRGKKETTKKNRDKIFGKQKGPHATECSPLYAGTFHDRELSGGGGVHHLLFDGLIYLGAKCLQQEISVGCTAGEGNEVEY